MDLLFYQEAREPLRRAIDDILHAERKYWKSLSAEDLKELETLHARFEDLALGTRLQQHVGKASWDREEQPDFSPRNYCQLRRFSPSIGPG